MQEQYGGHSFSIVGVTTADVETAREFAREHGLNYPVLAEADEVRSALGVDLVWGSAFFLVGPGGAIVAQGLEECEQRLAADLGAARSAE